MTERKKIETDKQTGGRREGQTLKGEREYDTGREREREGDMEGERVEREEGERDREREGEIGEREK